MVETYNDVPSLDCYLNRETWRDDIIRKILHSRAPKVLAVHGTWGTGKTSLLYQAYHEIGGRQYYFQEEGLEKLKRGDTAEKLKTQLKTRYDLEKDSRIVPIWFEAWQFQHEPNILAALLKEMRDQTEAHYKLWENIKETGTVTLATFLRSIDLSFSLFSKSFSPGLKNMGANAKEASREYNEERFSTPMSSVMMKKNLEEAIDQLLHLDKVSKGFRAFGGRNKKAVNRKLVIFIDDLDRCMPEKAFEILEAIKVYLNLKNCVFVLGMDIQAVEGMIAKYYGKILPETETETIGSKLKDLARLYLEKICQDVYHLPYPKHKERKTFLIDRLLKESLGDIGTRLINFKARTGESRELPLLEALKSLIDDYKFLPPFPRSIKVFANVLLSHLGDADRVEWVIENEERGLRALIIICYLYAFHYEVYQIISLYPNFYKELEGYCKPEDSEANLPNEVPHQELRNLKLPRLLGESVSLEDNTPSPEYFPYPNLRQVLWIREMIIDTGAITESDLENLIL